MGSMDWVASCKSRRNFEYCGVHPTYRGSGPWAERTRGYRNFYGLNLRSKGSMCGVEMKIHEEIGHCSNVPMS